MVLSDTHRDVRASISPGRLVREPRRSHGFTECLAGIDSGSA